VVLFGAVSLSSSRPFFFLGRQKVPGNGISAISEIPEKYQPNASQFLSNQFTVYPRFIKIIKFGKIFKYWNVCSVLFFLRGNW
jgi:hypothetical protein